MGWGLIQQCVHVCTGFWENFCAHPDDTGIDRVRKGLVSFSSTICFILCTLYFLYSGLKMPLGSVGAGLGMVGCGGFVVWLRIARRINPVFMALYAGVLVSTIILIDLNSLVTGTRHWPFVVILLDMLLIMRAPVRLTTTALGCVVAYFALVALERVTRFGLYDAPGLLAHDEREKEAEFLCDRPPCLAEPQAALARFIGDAALLILDFWITYAFAKSVAREKALTTAAVHTAQLLAESLSRFDLESAQALLDSTDDDGLPPGLQQAFRDSLRNLRVYRPYLPDALFVSLDRSARTSPTTGAGGPSGVEALPPAGPRACIVFTDVVGSTGLWSQDPVGMHEALLSHNHAIRVSIAEAGGYEVKTIGDSFMVAFATAADAVWFGLDVQRRLHEADWPPSLMALPQCAAASGGVWGGLTVRIGLHEGEVMRELNPVTGRADYFGTTVNVAARLEAASAHGAVTMEAGAYDALLRSPDHDDEEEEEGMPPPPPPPLPVALPPHVAELKESCRLKGIAADVELVSLYPEELGDRRHSMAEGSHDGGSPGGKLSVSGIGVAAGVAAEGTVSTAPAATVASAELCGDEEWGEAPAQWGLAVARLLACLDRCRGKVAAVLGRTVTVSWNASQRCGAHVESCLAFVDLLLVEEDLGGGGASGKQQQFALGCCVGSVCVGVLGREGQRFVTVSGPPVVLCRRLAEVARLKGVGCLFATTQGVSNLPPHIRPRLVPSSEWAVSEGTRLREQQVWRFDGDMCGLCPASPMSTRSNSLMVTASPAVSSLSTSVPFGVLRDRSDSLTILAAKQHSFALL